MVPELHLFIIWERAVPLVQSIMTDLLAKFTVKQAFQVYWTPALFADNLSRFYGQNLPSGSEKEQHCGRGAFSASSSWTSVPCMRRGKLPKERFWSMRMFSMPKLNTGNGPRVAIESMRRILRRNSLGI